MTEQAQTVQGSITGSDSPIDDLLLRRGIFVVQLGGGATTTLLGHARRTGPGTPIPAQTERR
ncbi:hypothetical protein [Streptomyces sp. NPDC058657]|uniref:hypothetical protein n=1 Tax=unclassified Streptomyces TaxID=2593676 RepID=UPI003655198B